MEEDIHSLNHISNIGERNEVKIISLVRDVASSKEILILGAYSFNGILRFKERRKNCKTF